jgi:MFS superfamily sulfate permease-like transporter
MASKEKLTTDSEEEQGPVKQKLIPTKNLRGLQVGYLTDGWKPYDPSISKQTWYIREILLGIVTCFTQVPQIVAFSLVANVDPTVGLHATWILGIICAIVGGRPAMINGSSGSFAAIICTFLPEPIEPATNGVGVEYLFPSVMVAGCIMLIFSVFRWSTRLVNIIGSTILIGFVDGLAITIAKSQVLHLQVWAPFFI